MNGYIAYYRVSIDMQRKGGLGLDAQKKQVRGFVAVATVA